MKKSKKLFSLVLVLFLFLFSFSSSSFEASSSEEKIEKNTILNVKKQNYIEGEIIIKYKDKEISLMSPLGSKESSNFLKSKSLELKENIVKSNISLVKIKDNKTVEEKIFELKDDPNIEYVQPNFQYYPISIVSDDVYNDLLWALDNKGQEVNGVSGTSGADISAIGAWAINEGTNATSIVAVIDTGVAYNHPDLQANMWDGANCKDDHGRDIGGCIHGYAFNRDSQGPDPIPSWHNFYYSHGTHVAGTIAAVKDNEKGIMGVAPNAKIMAISTDLTSFGVNKSINFAKHNGARVINASFGGSSSSCSALYDVFMYDAIKNFDGLFVAAAGNNGREHNNVDFFFHPAGYSQDTNCWDGLDNIISVAATDSDDNLANFSNFGEDFVHVGAPGGSFYKNGERHGKGLIYSAVADSRVYFEDFEDLVIPAIPSDWTKGGVNNNWRSYDTEWPGWGKVLYADTSYPYSNNASTTVTSTNYDLSDASGGSHYLGVWSRCQTELNGPDVWTDYMAIEFSKDGGATFAEMGKWDEGYLGGTGSGASALLSFPIPEAYNVSNFKFRFKWVTNGTDNNYDGCFIDDVLISRYSDGSDELYGYYNGTSMAAPHVAGLAALIDGYNPNLSTAQLKEIILESGDSINSLASTTITGKRINAEKALIMAGEYAEKDITSFKFADFAVGDISTSTISITVPFGTDVASLTPAIEISGETVSPDSGVALDFTSPVTYTVTALDGTTKDYTVTVSEATIHSKEITSFVFPGLAEGVISASTISITVPFGTNITSLTPAITITGQLISPASGEAQDFTNPVDYIVTANDNSTTTYAVTVDFGPDPVSLIFTDIYNDLILNGIDSNLDDVNIDNYDNFPDLFFEKSAPINGVSTTTGRITFNNPLDLVCSTTIDFLSDLDSALDMSETGLIDFNLSNTNASNLRNASATIVFYGLDNIGFSSISTATEIREKLIVFDDDGKLLDIDDLVSDNGTYNDTEKSYTINVLHFSKYLIDNIAPDNQDIVFSDDEYKQGGTTVEIVSSGDINNSIWLALSGTSIFEESATTTKATNGLATTILAPASEGEYKLYLVDLADNISEPSTATLTVDDTKPTVTKLGDGSYDYRILETLVVRSASIKPTRDNGDIKLVFSETINENSKSLVEKALNNGASGILEYLWNDDNSVITLINNSIKDVVFENDVMAVVSDLAGNTDTLLLIDSALEEDQIVANELGDASLDNSKPEIVVSNPTLELNIDVLGDNPLINLSPLVSSSGTGTIPALNISSSNVNVKVASNTLITSEDSSWDGIMKAPTVTSLTLPTTSGQRKTLSKAIEIGLPSTKLSFDKAVKLVLIGEANKRAGYTREGMSFTEIINVCGENSQEWANENLGDDGSCKVNSGSDLVIWTKHFTKFATYSQTTISSGGGGGGGGGTPSTYCSSVDYGPWQACVGSVQTRQVINQSPSSCTLTSAQQLVATRECVIEDEVEEIIEDVEKIIEIENPILPTLSNELKIEVLKRERARQVSVINNALTKRLAGRILLQVEENGEAWYLEPETLKKHYMGRPADAFSMMRTLGLGISEVNFKKFEEEGVPSRFSGRILLRVEANGEAYYINPVDMKMHFLNRPADAFTIMRELALGINNENISQIPLGMSELDIVRLIDIDLSLGMIKEEVRDLQRFLNTTDFKVALEGVGSKGRETNMFRDLTKEALIKFQAYYNLSKTGVFDEETRDFLIKY